jgi:hypothetical protein
VSPEAAAALLLRSGECDECDEAVQQHAGEPLGAPRRQRVRTRRATPDVSRQRRARSRQGRPRAAEAKSSSHAPGSVPSTTLTTTRPPSAHTPQRPQRRAAAALRLLCAQAALQRCRRSAAARCCAPAALQRWRRFAAGRCCSAALLRQRVRPPRSLALRLLHLRATPQAPPSSLPLSLPSLPTTLSVCHAARQAVSLA